MADGGFSNKTDIKIFILFLLNEINYPLDYSTLADIMAENGYVGSFDFAETFAELCDFGHIATYETENGKIYGISETGRIVAEELQGEIMQSIRDKSRKSALRHVSLKKRGAVPHTSIEKKDGRYIVTCELCEKEGMLYRASVAVTAEADAERIRDRFEKNPEAVYRGSMAVLTGEISEYLKDVGI